ncbi:MAG: arylamine N-acetyltransferase [Chloroflexota bacterium]
MDINAYLTRINYHGSLMPNVQTLHELQLAHLLAVPFENLSIHAGEPIILTDESLFDKVVRRERGGFCYELNGLFASLLRTLGFPVTMLSCRVATAEGDFSPDFDHMALMVSLDQRWLVDVGFGDTFREPLAIDDTDIQTQFGRAYRIVAEDAHYIMMEHKDDGTWKAEYRFHLQPYQYADYADMCHYHQTSPESHFTQRRICSRATPEGRVTLSEMRFITTTLSGERQERELTSEAEYTTMLQKHFDIVMSR